MEGRGGRVMYMDMRPLSEVLKVAYGGEFMASPRKDRERITGLLARYRRRGDRFMVGVCKDAMADIDRLKP